MPRKARLDAPGTLHHVIIRGIERRPIVDDEKDRENFVSRLGQLAVETETGIFAWTLMTNHAHILVKSGSFGLPNFMRRLLTGYAITYNLRHHSMATYSKIDINRSSVKKIRILRNWCAISISIQFEPIWFRQSKIWIVTDGPGTRPLWAKWIIPGWIVTMFCAGLEERLEGPEDPIVNL